MAVALTHTTVATGTDAGNAQIGKTQWNETHTLTMATSRLLGRTTAGAGAVEEISTGAGLTFSAGTLDVASVSLTTGVTGTLPVANGGTGLTAGTSGGVLYYSAAGTLASSAALAANSLLIGGGAGVAPSSITTGTGVVTALGVNTGSAGAFVVNGGALGTPSSGTVTNLTGTASININGTVGATTPNTGAFTSVTSTSASGILTRAAATQDGVELIGRAGGTTSLKVTFTPTTLTASRTITLPDANINFTTGLGVAQGGTGLTSGTSGGVLYYSATGTLASSAALAANALVVGGGAGVAPSTVTTGTGVVTALGVNTGTAGAFVVNGGALGTPSSGTVTNLTGTASININGTVGATTPNTGAFTSVTSTSEVVTGASGILTRAAATQDGVELIGRAGGTTSLKVTFTPTTLTASRTLTLPDLSGTVATTTGADGLFTRWMFQDTGWDWFDQADTNTAGTATLDYTQGSVQRWAPTGTRTLATSNWPPSGNLGELLIEGINLGAATITWPTINWITSTGATTTTFSNNGVTLQTSGTDWVFLWTRDAGTTIYGKVVR